MKVKTNMSLSPYYNQLLLVLTAALVGAAVGAVDAVFGKILLAISDVRNTYFVPLVLFLPLGGS